MENFKKSLQSFGKTLLFPISILSFMAIFLGLSAALQNPNITKFVPFLNAQWIQISLGLIRRLAGLPFGYLPLLFAMAIPLGMVKRDREVAVYSSVVGYIAMLIGMSYILNVQGVNANTTSVKYLMDTFGLDETQATLQSSSYSNVLGIFVYNMNVVGGIVAGLFGVLIHNKFRQTELHPSLTFYSGKRFVPIAAALIMVFVGMALVFIWPIINGAIISLGSVISGLKIFGVFLYGFIEKLINPTGLHHILNQAFRFTALGGVETVAGKVQVGALNIYLAELENHLPFSPRATEYLAQGKILHMVFGMPAVVFALYKCALKENQQKVMKYFIPGLTAVILTGITEPIEFTYIFISPILWFVNSILAGLSFMLPAMLGVTIGNIQGGIIDWFVFGVLQGTATKWYVYLFLGPIFFGIYYIVYSYIIKKFNILTVGRSASDFDEVEEETITVKDLSKEQNEMAQLLVDGLGGLDNIVDVDNCISRLRVEIKDKDRVKQSLLEKTKPNGIVIPDPHNVQIVYGGRVTKMRNLLDDYIFNAKK